MSASTIQNIRAALRETANAEDAAGCRRFFKTGPGEYGEGDRFLGVRVPWTRRVARRFRELSLTDVRTLLKSQFHEERLLALLLMAQRFERGGDEDREEIYSLYLTHTAWINNWDLVDSSAPQIVGGWLADRSREPLEDLARSDSLWERRIAVMATLTFIRQGDFQDALRLAEMLLHDPEDLIHKAAGWMLREIGNRDREVEETFLRRHGRDMPRTMLRYAIEKFPEAVRRDYLVRK